MILGQVIDGTSGLPVADAVVTLTPPGGRGRGAVNPNVNLGAGAQGQQAAAAAAMASALTGRGGAAGPLRVMTGADGRFVFHGLLPGPYSVQATLTGYTSNVNTGGAGAGGIAGIVAAFAGVGAGAGGGTTLPLKEGEFATAVKLRLWKLAVVTGSVLDDAGEPAVGTTVRVARRVMVAGRARFIPGESARTDDRGMFRISGLVPGSYLVVAPQAATAIPAAVMTSVIDSVTGTGPAGGGYVLLDAMSSGIDPTAAMAGGVRIGDYMVASAGLLPILSPDGRLLVFQTTFYPGAASPMQAAIVALKSGEERTDLNFQLRLIPTSRVSGTATGPDGPVANLGVRLLVPGDGTTSESEFEVASTLSRADGTFTFFGVPPGNFVLRATKQPRTEMPAEMLANPMFGQMFGGGGGGKPQTEVLFASTDVTVSGNIDNLALQLAPGFKVSGRLEFDFRTGRPVPTAQQMQAVSIALTAIDGRSAGGGILAGLGGLANPDRVDQKGEFKTKGYQAGRYFLTVTLPGAGAGPLQVRSATLGGRDVLDTAFDLTADMSGLVVTVVDQMASVSGTVTAPGETDFSEALVVLFPHNHRTWITNGMSARLAKSARASRNGAFNIGNVPAGEYFVVAIDQSAAGDLQDPAVIDALSRMATRITVTTDPAKVDLTKARVGK